MDRDRCINLLFFGAVISSCLSGCTDSGKGTGSSASTSRPITESSSGNGVGTGSEQAGTGAGTATGGIESTRQGTDATGHNPISIQTVDYAGYQTVLAKHRGKVVVVDAWATWCIPCVENFPHLVELHRTYASDGVACVSLSLDNLGDDDTSVEKMLPAIRTFLTKQSATFDNLVSAEPFSDMSVDEKLGVGQIPAVFVFDRDGKLAKTFTPGPDLPPQQMYAEVEALIKRLLR